MISYTLYRRKDKYSDQLMIMKNKHLAIMELILLVI